MRRMREGMLFTAIDQGETPRGPLHGGFSLFTAVALETVSCTSVAIVKFPVILSILKASGASGMPEAVPLVLYMYTNEFSR